MVKKLNGYLLTKKVRHKFLVKVRPFSGAKVSCMVDHIKAQLIFLVRKIASELNFQI